MSILLLLCMFIHLSLSFSPNPVADPKAIVTSGNVRFTVLTEQLIRMEYSSSSSFRDSASLPFLNRFLPVPSFSSQTDGGYLTIATDYVTVKYQINTGPFTASNLNVVVTVSNGVSTSWNMGSQPTGNLLGTVRTLDGVDGSTPLYCPKMGANDAYLNHCVLGLISRDGWVVYDDSDSAEWDNNNDWPWFVTKTGASCNVSYTDRIDCNPNDGNQKDCEAKNCCFNPVYDNTGVPWCFFSGPEVSTYQDLYFFGHGHNYPQALFDFTLVSGPISTFPRYIFGPQYSRYHAFNEVDERTIIEDWYEGLGVPLDVLVLDMDWHPTYNTGAPTCNPPVNGWTGYTWDKTLFPNPSRFLGWAHDKGLHITNNMHPAAGVQCMEEMYPPFAKAMGVDPSTNNSIDYAIQNKSYAENFFEIVLKPLSNFGKADGIDYWWIDYQQDENSVAPGINPTFWVNYAFSTTESWWGNNTRPLIMARWGGLGNHRLATIGFSGDTTTSWNSLAFQPYFTATASNVGFFWSHDLGGFNGQPDPELFVRWIQWGLFSNLLRTHCNGKLIGGGDTRDIWEYPAYYFRILRSAFILRSRLVPYIYTQHAQSYSTGVGLLRPMYYSYPEEDNAYNVAGQYMFGDSFLVSPIVQPNQGNNLTGVSIWIPEGLWIEYNSGQSFTGPTMIIRNYTLDEIPAFVPAGAIIPMRSELDSPTIGSAQQIPSILSFDLFPQSTSGSQSFVIEDDGISNDFEKGLQAITTIQMQASGDSAAVTISAASGKGFSGQRTTRAYQLNFIGAWPADTVQFNGQDISYEENPVDYTQNFWTYDVPTLTMQINIGTQITTTQEAMAKVTFVDSLQDPLLVSGFARKLSRLQQCKDLLDDEWGKYFPSSYPNLLLAAGSGYNTNITTVLETLQQFNSLFQAAIGELNSLSSTNEKALCLDFLQTA